MSRTTIVIVAIYLALLAGLTIGLVIARGQVMATDQTSADEEWEAWRAEARRQESGGGPVSRRAPKRDEPPTVLLLRDHFGTSLTVLLVLSSALYFTIALMIRGVLVAPRFEPNLE